MSHARKEKGSATTRVAPVLKVLESLFARPIVSVADVQRLIGTTYMAANTTVSRLEEIGVLQEVTGHARNRRFRYAPYIELFNND